MGLDTRGDFQRFCAELRVAGHELDDLVEALQALAASSLRPRDKTRFARNIARYLGESFHAAEVRAIGAVSWPPEIAMAIKRHTPAPEPSTSTVATPAVEVPEPEPPRPAPTVEVLEPLSDLPAATVVLLGDEQEHRASVEALRRQGVHCVRVSSARELSDAVQSDAVAGIVVGGSWWSTDDPPGAAPRRRLERILQQSNIAWIKLVRSPVWADAEAVLPEICTSLYTSMPPMTQLVVSGQATVTSVELRRLAEAIADLGYAERQVDYHFPPSIAQDRIIRAVTSRYLRAKFPALHGQQARLQVRSLASRRDHGLVALVSVEQTDVSFVLKVSPYADARQEARRFRMVAHGTSFEMEFYCHAMLGALVFAPIQTRLGHARSLDDLLGGRDPLTPMDERPAVSHAASIDAAIAALSRFCGQLRADDVSTFCTIEHEDTRAMVRRCGHIVVAEQRVDLWWLYLEGTEIIDRSADGAIVHGDAHPGNILFSTTGAAILIDFECAGLGPVGYDLSTLWIFALASRFVAVADEQQTIDLFVDLLRGLSFESLCRLHRETLRLASNVDVLYLASRAVEASVALTVEQGGARSDVYGIVAVILCRELFNPTLQQFVVRCGLAAARELLHPA